MEEIKSFDNPKELHVGNDHEASYDDLDSVTKIIIDYYDRKLYYLAIYIIYNNQINLIDVFKEVMSRYHFILYHIETNVDDHCDSEFDNDSPNAFRYNEFDSVYNTFSDAKYNDKCCFNQEEKIHLNKICNTINRSLNTGPFDLSGYLTKPALKK